MCIRDRFASVKTFLLTRVTGRAVKRVSDRFPTDTICVSENLFADTIRVSKNSFTDTKQLRLFFEHVPLYVHIL